MKKSYGYQRQWNGRSYLKKYEFSAQMIFLKCLEPNSEGLLGGSVAINATE